MKKFLILLLFVMQVGCGGFVEYTIITAGTLTGNILTEEYEHWDDDKEKEDDKK